ncbi:MAG TPA: hypothetical protein VFV50_14675 [Bdellovibrionales bacterium]|nr:hypothetical protein [Bdellovibrionales bacterium]
MKITHGALLVAVLISLILGACGSFNEGMKPAYDADDELTNKNITFTPDAHMTRQVLKFRASNGQYLRSGWNGRVGAVGTESNGWSRWHLVDLNGGLLENNDKIALRSAIGRYMVAERGGGDVVNANRPWRAAWEIFTLINMTRNGPVQSGDAVALQAANGMFVVAEEGGGGIVNANRSRIGPWETFTIALQFPNGSPGPALGGGNPQPQPQPQPVQPPAPNGTCYARLGARDENGAIREAAEWVRRNRLEFFNAEDRAIAYNMNTVVINILRHNGHDVGRALAHPSLPPSNPFRWGSDAIAYRTGNRWNIYDIYGSWPQPANPQTLFHGTSDNGEVTSDLIPVGSGSSCP